MISTDVDALIRAVPDGWTATTLGAIADPTLRAIVSGPFGSNIGSRFFVPAGIPVIRGSNLTTDMTRFIDDGFVYVTEEKADELGNCDAVAGDIVFTAAGTIGQVGLIPSHARFRRYIISNKQLRARVDQERVDPLFAFYWFSSRMMVSYIQQRNTGSSVPLINLGILRSLPIALPSLPEQRAIAHILGTLDDKIELNRRMNQTLEDLARALFHSWFVAFDPVRAKAAGRQPAGMDAATAALFPDSFEESELGEIPAGWRIANVGDLIRIARKTLNPATHPQESFDHHSLPAFDAGRNPVVETGAAIKSNKTIVEPGAVLISKLNPHIPRVWLPELSSERRSICSTEFLVVVPNNLSARPFIYALFTSEPFTQAFASLVTGTTGSHQRVSPESLLAMPIVVPAEQVMLRFCHAMDPLLQDRATNRALSMTFATIRDTLLPRLLSGEVRVGELGVNAAQAVGAPA